MSAHAKPVRHPLVDRVATAVNSAIRWVWADRHDDAIPNVIQGVLWGLALFLLFLLIGLSS